DSSPGLAPRWARRAHESARPRDHLQPHRARAGTGSDMTHTVAPPAAPPSVVVIDDTEGNRYVVSRLLRAAGMQVAEAANGHQGLELAHAHPDLVLVHWNGG